MSNGRYRAYPEYKDSGLPWMTQVPAHWTETRFKHLLADKKKVLRPDLPAGSISFGRVVYKGVEILSEDTKASYQEVLAGEFLINPLNLNYDFLSLRTALARIDVVVSTGYIVLRSTGRLHPNYTRWLLQQFDVAHMKTLGAGVRQTINYADIGNSYFFEPPLPEQTQIAKLLDHETAKIDRLIEKQEELIRLLKEKRQAVISHAVTKGLNPHAPLKDSGIEWLGQVPAHWKILRVKFASTFLTSGPRGWSERLADNGSLFIQSGDLNDQLGIEYSTAKRVVAGNDAETTRTRLFTGDVVVCITGAKTGNVSVAEAVHEKAFINQHLCLVRPDANTQPAFLGSFLKGQIGQTYFELSQYGLKQGLSLENVKEAPIARPPLEEQSAIVEHVKNQTAKFDSIIQESRETVTLLQERRTALISAAVTGKIDVRHWQPPVGSETGTPPDRGAFA